MGMKGDINQFGAPLRPGTKYDDHDEQPELEKRQIRRRMRYALDAVDALEWPTAKAQSTSCLPLIGTTRRIRWR